MPLAVLITPYTRARSFPWGIISVEGWKDSNKIYYDISCAPSAPLVRVAGDPRVRAPGLRVRSARHVARGRKRRSRGEHANVE